TYQVALGPAIGWTQEGIESMNRKNVSAVQTVYNILEQTPGNELIENATKRNVGILVRVPDASGILTGKVKADTKIDEKDHRSVRKGEWVKSALDKVEQLKPIAERNGLNIIELAIKFILSKNPVSSVLPTVISVEEIEQFSAMSDGKYLSGSDMSEIAELYSGWPSYELKATAQAA
ncbi:MAG: aldo/keto reductase, partial [Candidatus Nitrosotenuis sp.]